MSGVLKKEELYTVEDIFALPDGERAELIDGKIYYMAPPARTHQRLLGLLSRNIANYIEAKGGFCEVIPGPFAVILGEDGMNCLEPDISVICNPAKLDEKGCYGAPDWIVEIVSPDSQLRDYFTKLFKYKSAGVREYWIVDPAAGQIMVYRLTEETGERYPFGEDVPVGIYEGFTINLPAL